MHIGDTHQDVFVLPDYLDTRLDECDLSQNTTLNISIHSIRNVYLYERDKNLSEKFHPVSLHCEKCTGICFHLKYMKHLKTVFQKLHCPHFLLNWWEALGFALYFPFFIVCSYSLQII